MFMKVENIKKSFISENSDAHILDDINFNINENEFVVIFGPGQCGKTTLLNLIAGLEKPTDGQIILEGKKLLNQE